MQKKLPFEKPEDQPVLSVSELTLSIKQLLESEQSLRSILVSGELSNFTRHQGSGHLYFSLKDESSQIACVMFKRAASSLLFQPKQGDKVVVKASVTVYATRGSYQLLVEEMRKDGLGDLHRMFLELKEKLAKQGLFAAEHKRLIPKFPRRIGVVTSPTGAAVRDILDTLKRRFPCVHVIIAPAVVQGGEAPGSIISAMTLLNSIPCIDIIILARGGGSIEDLWGFNSEAVARAIYDSKIPVISGVGHETDFTIADFVADLRAPTPSIAAERAVPVRDELLAALERHHLSMARGLQKGIESRMQLVDGLAEMMLSSMRHILQQKKSALSLLAEKMKALDPDSVIRRGYSITMRNGSVLRSISGLKPEDELLTILNDGRIISGVKVVNRRG